MREQGSNHRGGLWKQRLWGPAPTMGVLHLETDSMPWRLAETGLSRPGPCRSQKGKTFPVSGAQIRRHVSDG